MRRIVIVHSKEEPTDGIVSSLALLGAKERENINVINWQPLVKSTHDMFDEIKPDLIVGGNNLPYINKFLIEQYQTKIVFCGSMPQKEIHPDLLLLQENIPDIIKKNCPFNWIQIDRAANIAKYRNGTFDIKKSCDILYYANASQMSILENKIFSVLAYSKYSFKIIGEPRPILNYIGEVDIQEIADFFVSAKVVLELDNNVAYDVAAQKGFCLTHGKHKLFPGFIDDIENVLPQIFEESNQKFSNTAFYDVWNNHTYLHRLKDMFDTLGWEDEGTLCLKVLKGITPND